MVGLRDVYLVAPAASFHPAAAAAAAHHEQFLSNAEAHSIIPLLTAAPYPLDDDSRSKIQLWQSQSLPSPQHPAPSQNPNPNPNSSASYLRKPSPALESSGILFVTGGSATCQDCGNQAKKDCSHRRCRTCCKSRGYDCSTHIKSTWVPAARRRERHITASDSAAVAAAASSPPTSALKKPRLLSSQTATTSHASNSNNTPPRSTGSSHQGDYLVSLYKYYFLSSFFDFFSHGLFYYSDPSFRENLPGHVTAPAVFKCVRVTSIHDGEDEYAYHAKVNIGGHVYKGFLYNQGFDQGISTDITGTSTSGDVNNNAGNADNAIHNFSELHLGGGGVRNVPHSDIYGLGGLLGGSAFGNAIN